jgi:hypothetical protein
VTPSPGVDLGEHDGSDTDEIEERPVDDAEHRSDRRRPEVTRQPVAPEHDQPEDPFSGRPSRRPLEENVVPEVRDRERPSPREQRDAEQQRRGECDESEDRDDEHGVDDECGPPTKHDGPVGSGRGL